jgi:uncharacterized protein (DUF2235 family)
MKRIAIFLDGTWNRPDAEHPTNVVRLARCVQHYDQYGTGQHVIYIPGVGSGEANTAVGRSLDKLFGGALGWGLLDIMEEAYRHLCFVYEPGDEIQVFGFSRGAFAARSLVGLIRSCGIPPRRHLARIPEALAFYAERGDDTHPESPRSYGFRRDFAPDTATSEAEYRDRRKHGDEGAIVLNIDYLGVWDTVSAMGLPVALPFSDEINAQYRFHDTKLSSMVLSARHAVSIDEHRDTFREHLWENSDDLNALHMQRNETVPRFLQLWFPGDHGSVGGGGSRIGLSSITLHFIAMGAVRAGLAISWEEFDRLAYRFDTREHLINKFGPVSATNEMLSVVSHDRSGPKTIDELSLSALDRYYHDPDWRPKTLDAVYDDLFKLSEADYLALRARMIARDGGPTHAPDRTSRPR